MSNLVKICFAMSAFALISCGTEQPTGEAQGQKTSNNNQPQPKTTCKPGFYGQDCKACTCQNGTCDDGISGDGSCSCDEDWIGQNCDTKILCRHGTLDPQTGNCLPGSCEEKYNGENCNECKDQLKTGENCDKCLNSRMTGERCDIEILCKNGTLDTQTGHCLSDSCDSKFIGTDCDIEILCKNGTLDTQTGHCLNGSCDSLFTGDDCNECVYAPMTGPKCDQCKNNKLGPKCDIDTVNINGQTWAAKNMYGTVSNDGSNVTCYANTKEDSNFEANYGCLYIWEDAQKMCPTGWHLPTETELNKLLTYAGGARPTGSQNLRATSWESGADKYGFGALPAGKYYGNDNSSFYDAFGSYANFWSQSEDDSDNAFRLSLSTSYASVNTAAKRYGYSVRCIKD